MTKEQIQILINHLIELQKDEKRGPGAMATLRRALSGEQDDVLRAYPTIGRYLPYSIQEQNDCILVSALFAEHQISGGGEWDNIGAHLSALRRRKQDQNESIESLDRRFSALVASSRTELPYHLRAAIKFLKDAEIPIQWVNLLGDVLYWEFESQDSKRPSPPRRWANAYWQSPRETIYVSDADFS